MAAGMAAVTLCTSLVSVPVYAAEASVSVDEAMYVNLDCYGSVDKVNVVKGVSLNGLTSFTDYGNYLDVTNMTNNTAPEISDGKVTWNLPADTKGYFYYKGAIDKDAVTLPWTMDVSYKLNGVPTDAEKLAGASGLVEVHVTATPNEAARDYYKNNMMLVVAMLVDMSKCYSVEAEDSQTQSLGSQTAIMYTALPGEEGDYTIRIGSDKFETSGVIMAMVPGTVKDLEHIVDLKDAKDTWKDAGDQLYDSMDQMAASVEAMRSGVNELRQGLNEAESARGVISGSKDEILDSNDQTLASLTALSEQLGTIVPYIQTAKDASEVAHNSMTDVVNTLGNMQEPIRRLDTSLRGLRDSSEGASGSIGNVVASVQLIKKLDTQLQQSPGTGSGSSGSRHLRRSCGNAECPGTYRNLKAEGESAPPGGFLQQCPCGRYSRYARRCIQYIKIPGTDHRPDGLSDRGCEGVKGLPGCLLPGSPVSPG